MLYRTVLFLKIIAILVYAGGLVAACVASVPAEKKRAVHGIASPALLIEWILGFVLTQLGDLALSELWIVSGLGVSFVSMLALVSSLSPKRPPTISRFVAVITLVITVAIMVFRPTWAMLRT